MGHLHSSKWINEKIGHPRKYAWRHTNKTSIQGLNGQSLYLKLLKKPLVNRSIKDGNLLQKYNEKKTFRDIDIYTDFLYPFIIRGTSWGAK